jgi:hypothetical protein
MYLGDSMQGKRLYYQYMIRFTKRVTGTWCLMPAANKADLLDICRSEMLRIPQLYTKDQLVVGLAGSYKEACKLAGQIVLDVLNQTGGTDIHNYFKND